MPIKFLLLGGGGLGFFRRGGWKCQFYFYGRGDFSDFRARYHRVVGFHPFGRQNFLPILHPRLHSEKAQMSMKFVSATFVFF